MKQRERVLWAVSGPVDFLVAHRPDAQPAGDHGRNPPSTDGFTRWLGDRAAAAPAEWTTNPRPGRGILGIAGDPTEVQVPLVMAMADQRGPISTV